MQYELGRIPSGASGTDATLRTIGRLVTESQNRPVVRIVALSILERANVDTRDLYQVMRALWEWTRRTIRYIRDPRDVETVQSPEITLHLKAGDCDDHAALMAAFAVNLGIPTGFVTIGLNADTQSHIYPEFFVNGRWIAGDTTSGQGFGYRAHLPSEKHYTTEGKAMPSLSGPTTFLPIRTVDLQQKMYNAAYNQLRFNWQRGLINRSDVASYLRVIAEGNHPGRGTIAEKPMKDAITDFLSQIDSHAWVSSKPVGALNGLEGLDGFLSSVWNAVKGVVGGAIGGVVKIAGGVLKSITGGGGSEVTVQIPAPNQQTIPTTPQPTVIYDQSQGLSLSNPVVLVGLGLAVLLLVRR